MFISSMIILMFIKNEALSGKSCRVIYLNLYNLFCFTHVHVYLHIRAYTNVLNYFLSIENLKLE